ncbi:MAG: hypothetical protein AAFO07_10570 [Bacteroidota bacterium]
MALIKLIDLTNTLQGTRNSLLSSSNDDGMVSRDDLKNLLNQTEDPLKKRFLEFFYSFLIKLEDRPRMRVTEEIIDKGIAFIQEQLFPHFEIKESFTLKTNQQIADIHETALPIAMELIRFTADGTRLSPLEVSERIAVLSEGLLFDDYGSEAGIGIEPFFVEHEEKTISRYSFAKALGLDTSTPKERIERFDSADRVLLTFMEQHFRSPNADNARTLVELMQNNLSQHTIIVQGQDNHPDLESNHPVYVFGVGPDGNLAGFKSVVIWT